MFRRVTFALVTTVSALAALQLAATSCGPGDACEVTATCPPEGGEGGAGASGGQAGPGGSGGTAAGQGGAGGQLAPNGADCGSGDDCESGLCVDTVCCDAACDGACVSCNLAGLEGSCNPHPPGGDPDGDCGDGVCDGSGACALGDHLWSQRFGDSEDQFANGLAVAPDGRSALVGVFVGNPNFGAGPLPYEGQGDAFVAMFESNGDLAWANAHGSSDNQDNAQAAAFDPAGNLVVTGWYNSTALSFGGSSLPHTSSIEIFLVKLNATGGHLWSKGFTGPFNQLAADVGVASDGAIVIVGEYGALSANPGEASFDFGTGMLAHGGNTDGFIARFDENGTPTWAIGFGDDAAQTATRVAVAANGDIAVIGSAAGTSTLGNQTLSNGGDYVVVLDANGNVQWSFQITPPSMGSVVFRDVAFAPDGSVVVSGRLDGTVDLGGGPVTATSSNYNAFVARYDDSGAFVGAQTVSDPVTHREGDALAIDAGGNVVLYGEFQGNAFWAKLASTLEVLWVDTFEHANSNLTIGVASDGTSVLGGTFAGTVNFGGMALPSAGGSDVFLAKRAP